MKTKMGGEEWKQDKNKMKKRKIWKAKKVEQGKRGRKRNKKRSKVRLQKGTENKDTMMMIKKKKNVT